MYMQASTDHSPPPTSAGRPGALGRPQQTTGGTAALAAAVTAWEALQARATRQRQRQAAWQLARLQFGGTVARKTVPVWCGDSTTVGGGGAVRQAAIGSALPNGSLPVGRRSLRLLSLPLHHHRPPATPKGARFPLACTRYPTSRVKPG